MLLDALDLEIILQSLDECATQKQGLATFYGSKGKNKSAADLQLNCIQIQNTMRKIKEAQINASAPIHLTANGTYANH